MIRLLGVTAISAIIVYLGITASLNLSKRVEELRLVLLLIDKLRTNLTYKQTHTRDMIFELANENEFSPLLFLKDCEESLKSEANITYIWKRSVERREKQLHMDKSDVRLLISIGGILGSADSKSQIEELKLLSDFISKNLESASAVYQTQGKLYRSLGVLSGIGIAIVLI